MKNSKQNGLAIVFCAIALVVMTTGTVFAGEDGTQVRKTPEQIEAYKAEMRAQKAGQIEEYKAQLRAQKASEIEAYKAQLRATKEQRIQELEENRSAQQLENQTRIEEKVANFVESLTEKVTAYYDRLSQLSEKLQSRIDKLEEEGADVTEANAKLEIADATLEEAYQNALVIIDEIAAMEINSSESLGEVISKVRELKNPFQSALRAYKDVATEIRIALQELKAETEQGEN